jgi:phosphoribosylformylglycinamidine synthase I
MEKPSALVLQAPGINCDRETAYALELAGACVESKHISELKENPGLLKHFQMFYLSGGFSYGDHLGAGLVQAIEMIANLREPILEFVEKGGLVAGTCNGFQALVQTGLLPYGEMLTDMGKRKAALVPNDVGHFVCRWVNLKTEDGACEYLRGLEGPIELPVAHGEGKFVVSDQDLAQIEAQKMVAFRYVDALGNPTQNFPDNPNGSMNAIAGLSSPNGRIIGLMPHFERFVLPIQDPKRGRRAVETPHGLPIVQRMVAFAAQS